MNRSGDAEPLLDPGKPITRITQEGFTLNYYTRGATETRVEVREGEIPQAAYRPPGTEHEAYKPKWRYVFVGGSQRKHWHQITISNLKPGTRYYYKIADEGLEPTSQEKAWGAVKGWHREYAVSTLAPKGRKTIIHLPIKVLIMPNVINVASAYATNAGDVPLPKKATPEQIELIKEEFRRSARFFWVNSGMRYWVDYQFFVDERWQRWGDEPANADRFYKGWPMSRSHAGKDYADPGGGDFTIFDTKDPLKVGKDPIYEERPYSSQVEMAWPQRWNATAKKWEYYNSGGGTYGVDSFPQGFPGRSQFLGGGDTAWLATHEVHHSFESHGSFALSNREDERVVFNHYAARFRRQKPDGTYEENTWATSGRHGEHWDGMAFWDRQLSDAQWLRWYFGYTVTVEDADMDGFPDNDPKLPLDEKRFGSDLHKVKTDGHITDLQKVMLSTWVPGPLQTSWVRAPFQGKVPNPTNPDSDGDGHNDAEDPYPLEPWEPYIYPFTPQVDGDISEWHSVPSAGVRTDGPIKIEFKQAHDQAAYYGSFMISGPWKRVSANFDGEGLGIYSGQGVQGFEIINGDEITVRPAFGSALGLVWKARTINGATRFEFKFPNRGEGIWFWDKGGREIGSVISFYDDKNAGYSIYEPYHFFYARMLEPFGQDPLPPNPPADLGTATDATIVFPAQLKLSPGWVAEGSTIVHTGPDESAAHVDRLEAGEFHLWMRFEAKGDGILGAFTKGNSEVSAGRDYIGFVGGYSNTVTRLRLFGQERGDSGVVITPGIHTMQLSRVGGGVWLIFDGKPIIWTPDSNPKAVVDRLAVLGGYGGAQKIHEVRYKVVKP